MTEPQQPFIHEDGTTTPAAAVLDAVALERVRHQIHELVRAHGDQDVVILLKMLLDPSMLTTITALTGFDASHRALVADVALALMTADQARPRLVSNLRKLIEAST